MNIIFVGTTGVHHVLAAAHLYLGDQIENLPGLKHFNDLQQEREGYPIYIGDDADHNHVYTLGAGNEIQMVKKSLEQLIDILEVPKENLLIYPIYIKLDQIVLLYNLAAQLKTPGFIKRLESLVRVLIRKQLPFLERQIEEFKRVLYASKTASY